MAVDSRLQSPEDKIDELNQQAWDIRIANSIRAQELSYEALGLAIKVGYTKGKAEGLRTGGFCLIRLSKHEEAYTWLKEALSLFEAINDLKGQSTVYQYFGIIQRTWGDLGASLDFILKALALSEQTAFTEHETTNYYQLGVTYKHLGNYEKALDSLYKCLSLSRDLKFELMEAYAINVIGSIYFENEDYTRALEYYQQGLISRQQSGDKWGEAGSLDNIGSIHLKLGAWEQAIDYCERSLVISQSTGDKRGEANALLHLAEIYKQTNDVQQASRFSNESLLIRQAIGDKKGEAEILLFLGELQRINFKPADKNELLQGLFKALKIGEDSKAADLVGKTHWALYESYKLSGNYGEALAHLELYIRIEKELHKDAVSQKVANLEISHRAEESKKETEIFRLKNAELAETLLELKNTQAQLIQSEKMASLGELTAGIAHEIQNPLNFVNNFSEINTELVDEMQQAIVNRNLDEVKEIATSIKENQEKITHHGKRADAIVKGMLQHSRSSSGIKEPTNINILADEYLRLAYHGLRAKDKSFNATMKTDFDEAIGNISIIPQDIGRVILNLITNAFYVVNERKKQNEAGYDPTVTVSTKKVADKVEVKVRDNGNGIPPNVLEKIFQPFFTTKPTGQGTGLGLSLSYDIVKAHGGELKVETKEGEGTEFIIQLPV